jgi:hypothetical protein
MNRYIQAHVVWHYELIYSLPDIGAQRGDWSLDLSKTRYACTICPCPSLVMVMEIL